MFELALLLGVAGLHLPPIGPETDVRTSYAPKPRPAATVVVEAQVSPDPVVIVRAVDYRTAECHPAMDGSVIGREDAPPLARCFQP